MRYIIGHGSHSQVVYAILQEEEKNDIRFLSFPHALSEDKKQELCETIRSRYAGGSDEVTAKRTEADTFIIAIGDNEMRMVVDERYRALRLTYMNAIHPRASICAKTVRMGQGNIVCAGAVIQTGTVIGNHNIFNTNCSIDHHNVIGDGCHVAPNAALCGNVRVCDGAFIGVGASIVPETIVRPCQFVRANTVLKQSKDNAMLRIYETTIYKDHAIKAIESGWVSAHGSYVSKAQEALSTVIKCPYVLLLNNGTCATHALFLALRHFHPEITKIYVPNNVYVAAWNAALMTYPIDKLEVLKMNERTWNMCTDETYIHSLDQHAAVLVVHNVGQVVDVPRLKSIRPDLIFIEDNCEGLFGKYDSVTFSGCSDAILCASVSFFGNKIITSGEGGAILTAHKHVYDYLAKVCNQGMTETKYLHDVLGYNYRMTNVQAALLYDQLLHLTVILQEKHRLFARYRQLIRDCSSAKLVLPENETNTTSAPWMFAVRITGNTNSQALQKYMTNHGIETRPMFYPIHRHAHLEALRHVTDNDIPEQLHSEIIMLPSYPGLTEFEQRYIIYTLAHYCCPFVENMHV